MIAERTVLALGGIGITAVNLNRGPHNPPLDLAFDSVDRARRVQAALAALLKRRLSPDQLPARISSDRVLRDLARVAAAIPPDLDLARARPAIFALRFFSRQHGTWEERAHGDPTAFLPDARGQLDLRAYAYAARSDPSAGPGATMINCDHGWYDEDGDFWVHANHGDPGMRIFQSTLAHFSRPLAAFDRLAFCVALARVG